MKISIHPFWIVALLCIFAPCRGWAQNVTLINTYTNPAPASGDNFGYTVAAAGNDRVLIGAAFDSAGALYAGSAYLFSTNGALLTTFTNPTVTVDDEFGIALAAVGSDRVIIGARSGGARAFYSGVAYLFNTNGTLCMTFTNPTPASDQFGRAVAAMGNDRVLIGAPFDGTGATDAGAAYLFGTNGALLATFLNPAPAAEDEFGLILAAAGSDRVLIGTPWDDTGAADSGVMYLFSTNGTLLTTFTNPTPASLDCFGASVAAVGNDRVLIGAFGDDTGASSAGAAYLFNTNGTLLITFTNPTPASSDYFGNAVAALGSDRLLIGADMKNTGASDAGVVYLFSTTGALLTTITNPTPAVSDYFGNAMAAVGNDRVLIGAYKDDTGATDAGTAYLFSAPPAVAPLLSLVNPRWVGTNFTFSFQTQSDASYTVEYNGDLRTTNWEFCCTMTGNGSLWPCSIPMTNTAQRFFRVRQP